MSETLYLIVKRDLFYMPNDKGYTGIRDRAGRYTLEQVAQRFPNFDSPNQDGMSFIAEDEAPEFSPACWEDVKLYHRTQQLEAAVSELGRLKVEMERLRSQIFNIDAAMNAGMSMHATMMLSEMVKSIKEASQ